MDEIERFSSEVRANVDRLLGDADMQALSRAWLSEVTRRRYTYNFSWLGRPVIQLPQDLLAVQELIWQVRPDLIVETGIAHGGSLIHSASLLEILGGDGIVVGVDVDIRAHNRREIEAHPLARRIRLIEGSSTDEAVAAAVREQARGRRGDGHPRLQSHPRARAGAYAAGRATSVVFDTLIEDLPDELRGRPGKGNNSRPRWEFSKTTDRRDRRAHARQAAPHVRARRLSAVHR
jgi:cephalosporin hydroxylase